MNNVINVLETLNEYMKSEKIAGSITYRSETSHMVRCGRSQISLNVSEMGQKFFVDLQEGKRKISGSTTAQPSEFDKIKDFIKALHNKIEIMPEVNHMTPMTAIAQGDLNKHTPDQKIVNMESATMVDLFKSIGDKFSDSNVEISGAFSSGVYSYAVINTMVEKAVSYQGSDFNVEAVLQLLDHDKKEVRAANVGENLSDYSKESILNELECMYDVKVSTKRIDLDAGKYDVVFTADAFAEMTNYVGYVAFSGETYEYQMGMLQKDTHKIGTKLFGENISIIDDPTDPDILFARTVGRNGVERKNFPLITDGVLNNFFYSDKDTCDRFSIEVNNDANVASLKVNTGKGPSDFQEMIKSCDKPTLFIPFIHYMNFTNAAKGEFTGTSRFGTFFVKGGEIQNHVYNLRINDSFHHIFNNVEWLSDKLAHINTSDTYGMRSASSIACPKFVKVNDVSITGSSAPKE